MGRDMGNDIAPEVRGRWITMLEKHHRSFPGFDVSHLRAKNPDALYLMWNHD
jgi:hypothetical protein